MAEQVESVVFVASPPKTVAYMRVSTIGQDTGNQRLALLEFARREHIEIDESLEVSASSQRSGHDRKIDGLLDAVSSSDLVLVSELSCLGRSIGRIIELLDILVKREIRIIAVKEDIRIDGRQDIRSKVITTLFALFAEVDRDLISERPREGSGQGVPQVL